MKTPEEYLKEVNSLTERKRLYEIGLQIQKDAYNEALEDAAKSAYIKKYKNYTARSEWDWEYEVNKQSILKLKKE